MCEYGCYHAGPIDWSWLKGALLVIGLLSLAFIAGCADHPGDSQYAKKLGHPYATFVTDDGVRCITNSAGALACDFASPQAQPDYR